MRRRRNPEYKPLEEYSSVEEVEAALAAGDTELADVSFRISKSPVQYRPYTGEVFRENPIPEIAKQARGRGPATKEPLRAAGLSPIDWDTVLYYAESEELKYVSSLWGLGKLLTTNEKTKKPRKKSNKYGIIKGLSLMPHYYPSLLNTVGVDEKGQLDKVSIERFNSFQGRSESSAIRDSAVPREELLTFCTKSSSFCRSSCLLFTGNNPVGKENATSKARKSYALLENPELFVALLRKELMSFAKSAIRRGLDPVVRLNMLSDIPWYELCPELLIEGSEYGIVWYDYTKIPFWDNPSYQEVSDILDLTFSFSGSNEKDCQEALHAGHRIAVCFAPQNPERWAGIETRTTFGEVYGLGRESGLIDNKGNIELFDGSWEFIDGDSSDYRIDDPAPSIVCLNFKEPSLGRFDPQYKALWEPIPLARKRFSRQMEDPERLGEIYSKAIRSKRFAKHLAEKKGVSKRMVADKTSQKQFVQTVPFDEVVEEYLAFEDISPERALKVLDSEMSRSAQAAQKRAATIASLSSEEKQELRDARAAQKRSQLQARKEKELSVSMFPIEGTSLMVGPHVPTILED